MVVCIALDSVQPLVYGHLTDSLVKRKSEQAIAMLIVWGVLGALSRVVTYIRERYEVDHVDWDINLRIMNEALERICGFSMSQCAQSHTGKTRDLVSKGRAAMKQMVFLALYRLGPTLLELGIATLALLWFSPIVGIFTLFGTFTYLVFAVVLFVCHRKPLKNIEDRGNENGRLFADILSNMEVVMANARQTRTLQEFALDGGGTAEQGKSFWRGALGWYYVRNGTAFVFRIVATGTIAYCFFYGDFSFGMFVTLTAWMNSAVTATQQLGQMQREISGAWAQIELYLNLLQQPPEISIIENPVHQERLSGDIEFRNVTFRYDPRATEPTQKPPAPVIALNDVSLHITPGEKVALVGESGAGKSTVAYALMRARDPQEGHIYIDGVDLRTWDLDVVRSRIGYVPQKPQLFDKSLRYNLTFSLNGHVDNIDEERLHQVLETVKLGQLAANGGLDSKLGENGHTLSGGERQRLCIARALIKDPDILIFDEATSSLDPVNEKKVQDAIDAARGRTKLIIAHRYSTIRDVDRIIVFDSGRAIDDGTHPELLKRCNYYRALLQQQGLL